MSLRPRREFANSKYCESCMMPLSQDTGARESEKYCSHCFKNGKLVYEGDNLEQFKKVSYEEMRKKGVNPILAKFYTWMIGFAPRWKK